jgi:hypothetical protein
MVVLQNLIGFSKTSKLTLAYQVVILRIAPLGKLGHFNSTAHFLHCFNQLSEWADYKYYLLVLKSSP